MSIIVEKISKTIVSILINRPSKRNSINYVTFKSLLGAIEEFESDNEAKVAIIAGAEGNFCAGYDLNEIIDVQTGLPNTNLVRKILLPLGNRLSNRKITIAAIEGHAAGFGYELALKCDFRVADKDSRMGFMNRRFGIPIMNGGSVILPRLVGNSRAMELIATGKAQLADEALNCGVINYISDVGCAQGRSLTLARCLTKFEQESLISDLKAFSMNAPVKVDKEVMRLLQEERERALAFLEKCGPRDVARKFIQGELCRHGSYDLGNLMKPKAEVSL